jgi:hypothetical protein
MRIPGYVEQFEKLLLSEKSKEQDRIIYWLGHEATSRPEILNQLKQNSTKGDIYSYIFDFPQQSGIYFSFGLIWKVIII